MGNEDFKKALTGFVKDFASGGAIRSLADKGYTVDEIKAALDFPIERREIGEIVWKHYIETGVICLEDPAEKPAGETYTFEKVIDQYGKPCFKRVAKQMTYEGEYIPCDLGQRLREDREGVLAKLDPAFKDAGYVDGLPWPPKTVWHRKDERIVRIMRALS